MKTKIYHLLSGSLVVLAFIISACGTNAPAANSEANAQPAEAIAVTIYSDDAYPPYSYQENGEPKGIYVNILNSAFSQLDGYKVTITPVPWKRGLGYLEAGIGLGLVPPYYRPDARPWMDYSVPILDESLVLFCRDDVLQTPRPNWPQDYQGLKVGNNLGFVTFKESAEELAKYDIIIEDTASTEANLLKLANKQVDCYANDKLSILWELQRLKSEGKYLPGKGQAEILESVTLSSEQGYVGFTNQDKGAFSYKADFKLKLNEILTAMKDNGEIQKIVDQFISKQ